MGEIQINLNWNQKDKKTGGFFTSLLRKIGGIDLDLGCFYELKNGAKGCIQALGNYYLGSLHSNPYIELDGDVRTGTVSCGENLRINGDKISEFRRVLVYSLLYQGAANWSHADGIVTLKYLAGPDIEVKLNEHQNGKIMCAIAMIENENNETFKVERLVEYFKGYREMDRAYGWGMNWLVGIK